MKTFRILTKEYSAAEVIDRACWGPRWILFMALFTLVDTLRPFWRSMLPAFEGKKISWIVGSSFMSHIAKQYVDTSSKTLFGLLSVVLTALLFVGFYVACWHLTKTGNKKAYVAAMGVYAADGVAALFFGNWVSVGIHAFILFNLDCLRHFCWATAEAEESLATPVPPPLPPA
jgi:MFS family permease